MLNQRVLVWMLVVGGIILSIVMASHLDRWLYSPWLSPSFGLISLAFLFVALIGRKNPPMVRTGVFGAIGSLVLAASVYSKGWPGNLWLTSLGSALMFAGWLVGMRRLSFSRKEEGAGPKR